MWSQDPLLISRRLLERLKRKVSGRPARFDAVSLLCHQHSLIPSLQRNLSVSSLFGSRLEKRPTDNGYPNTDIVREWAIHPVSLCALREGLIHSSTGIIHDQAAGKYLLETSWGWGKYTTAAARIFNGRVHRISSAKPLYVFSSVGYHGIVEDLSAILALQERGHRFDVILEKRNSWMSKLVQLFLPADDSVIQTEAGVWISAPNLLITTKSAFGEFPHPDLLATLRRGARRLEGKSAFAPRLFISRGDAPSRTCPEETRIAEHYRGRGYQTLRLSEIHVRDQVLALREATAVAGLHGAGLTNLVWGQKAIRVHELYFSSWFNSCYACLSHSLGHSYHNLKIDPDAAGGTDPLQRLTDLPDDGWPASAASPARS